VVADLEKGYLRSGSPGGHWYVTDDQASLGLWPEPASVSDVIVQYVYVPTALVLDTDSPVSIPEEFHTALLLYVASQYYATVEDNAELAQINEERYRAKAGELDRLRISKETGDQPFHIRIAGVTG
jgi:hypothetical protein